MPQYIVGIDDKNAVFVCPSSWKRSESSVWWPTVSRWEHLIENGTAPASNWKTYSCRWTHFSSDNYEAANLHRDKTIASIESESSDSDFGSIARGIHISTGLDFNEVNDFCSQSPAPFFATAATASIASVGSEVSSERSTCTSSNTGACQQCDVWLPKIQLDIEYLKANSEKLIAMMERFSVSATRETNATKDDLLPNFPISSIESFNLFDESLKNNNVYDQMVNKMMKIGGKSPGKAVTAALSSVMATEVVILFTWHGIRNKLMFKTTQLARLIMATFASPELTERKIVECISKWMSHELEDHKKKHPDLYTKT